MKENKNNVTIEKDTKDIDYIEQAKNITMAQDEFGMPTSSAFAVNLDENEENILKNAEKQSLEKFLADGGEKGFKKFLKNTLPWRGDPVSEIIRKCVFMVSVIVVVVSCGILADKYLIEPNVAEKDMQGVQGLVSDSNKELTWDDIHKKYPDTDFPEGMQLKYAEAYAQNNDLIGWLSIDKLGMEFPILQTDNDSYYLKRSFTHRYTDLGNPFLACDNNVKELDRNSIIYGHSTRSNDKIFSKLFDYRTIRGFKNNPVIEFNTIYKDYKWKVYAAFITSATKAGDNDYFFNYIFRNLSSDEEFMRYVKELDRRKLYTTGVDIKPTDKILTLSTCLYDFDNARFVVVARMVRDGESDSVDTSLAKENPNPQYPQIWYDKKGIPNPFKNTPKWYAK